MHIHIVPNRNSAPAALLRESYREGKTVRKRTLANLSALPMDQIEAIRLILKGQRLAPVDTLFDVTATRHHGHVHAVRLAMKRLGFDNLLASRSCRERDLVVAMVASRILDPDSKLATVRRWRTSTLAEDLSVGGASEDELYEAMDWLVERQAKIEARLAARHLDQDGLALFDLSSSYFEGVTCPLAALGHSRDGKRGTLQVNYGLLTSRGGCPVSIEAYPGNTSDATTLLPYVTKIKQQFGISSFVIVGDRGMISQKQIVALKELDGIDWIGALKTPAIRALLEEGAIQPGLFDERNLMELRHSDYPGERLMVCRNALMADRRARTRQSLLDATGAELLKVQQQVARGTLHGKDRIGVRVGRVVNKYKVAKHFILQVDEAQFAFPRDEASIAAETALDGFYVIRTSLSAQRMSTEDAVLSYKSLSDVERAFRSVKTVDLQVRPIYHRLEERVRAHLFVCMLAYYVEWHMREAWRELMFADEDQQAKTSRDPVVPARRSAKALSKVHSRRLEDGTEAHSFGTLLDELRTIARSTCRRKGASEAEPGFTLETTPNAKQQKALDLLQKIRM